MAADELGQRMHDDVGAMLDRAQQIGAGQRVVDDQRQAVLAGDVADLLDIDELAAGIGKALDEDAARLVVDLVFESGDVVDITPAHFPAEILEGMAELVDRTAVKLSGSNEIFAGPQDGVEDQKLRAVAGRGRQCGGAALERRHAAPRAPPASGS